MRTSIKFLTVGVFFFSSLIGLTSCKKGSGIEPGSGTNPQANTPKVLRTERLTFSASSTDAERIRTLRKGALRNNLPYYLEGKDTVKIQPANWTVTKFVSELRDKIYVSQSADNKGKKIRLEMFPSDVYEAVYANAVNGISTETSPDQYSGLMTAETAIFGLYDLKIEKTMTLPNGNPLWVSQEITPGSGEYLRVFINLRGSFIVVSRVKDLRYDANGILIAETILPRQSASWALREIPVSASGRVAVSETSAASRFTKMVPQFGVETFSPFAK